MKGDLEKLCLNAVSMLFHFKTEGNELAGLLDSVRHFYLQERRQEVSAGFAPLLWCDAKTSQAVYVDNFYGGRFPKASPKILGPFTVASAHDRVLLGRHGVFRNPDENILTKKVELGGEPCARNVFAG